MTKLTPDIVIDSMLEGDWPLLGDDEDLTERRIDYASNYDETKSERLIKYIRDSSKEKLREEVEKLESGNYDDDLPEYFRLGFIRVYLDEVMNMGLTGKIRDKAVYALQLSA